MHKPVLTMRKFFYLLFLPLVFAACSSDGDDAGNSTAGVEANVNKNNATANRLYARLEFPHLNEQGTSLVVTHLVPTYGLNYAVEWDYVKHAQRWTCYKMYASNSVTNTKRFYDDSGQPFSQYPNDKSLSTRYHFTTDPYWGSGYDHGHMCPSADRLCSEEANKQTFFLTNMHPQVNTFNAGLWEHMEARVRQWNNSNFRDTLYVVKGGTIDRDDQLGAENGRGVYNTYLGSGVNRIPVPKYFFMAVLCKRKDGRNQGYKAMAFWAEHKSNASTTLRNYAISVDQLEQLTGIDFFCNLPDQIEEAAESVSKDAILVDWNL